MRKDEIEQTHDFIDGLNAGSVSIALAGLVSEGAASAVEHNKKTTLTLKVDIEALKDNPGQVKVTSDLSYKMPCSDGAKSRNQTKVTFMAHNPDGTVTLRPVGVSDLFSGSGQEA